MPVIVLRGGKVAHAAAFVSEHSLLIEELRASEPVAGQLVFQLHVVKLVVGLEVLSVLCGFLHFYNLRGRNS